MTDDTEGHAEQQPIGRSEAAANLGEILKKEPEQEAPPVAEEPEEVTADEEDYDPLKVEDEQPDSEEPEPEAEDPDDQLVEIELDGEKVEVTLKELKRGHLRESDYTRKTQALSEERQKHQAELETARKERAEQLSAVNALIQKATEQIRGKLAEPDDSLLDPSSDKYNPDEYTRQKAQYDKANDRVNALYQEAAQISHQQRVEYTKQIDEHAAKQKERLESAIPDLKDGRKKGKIMSVIEGELKRLGYNETQIRGVRDPQSGLIVQPGIVDAGVFEMAFNSARMRAQLESREKVRKKVRNAKPMKPGSPKGRGDAKEDALREVKSKALQTGHRQDAAKAIQTILQNR